MPLLAHQKLDVYRRAIELLALASQIATSAPRGNSFLTDQLKRAALSIPLNIAEGAGRFGAPDGARFHSIAPGLRDGVQGDRGCLCGPATRLGRHSATGHGAADPHRGDAHALVPER
ncbi:MAG: four helix bundle protein [Myxococcales bacterium]|nr:four helix bundle protein [Myxococcales bacterium]